MAMHQAKSLDKGLRNEAEHIGMLMGLAVDEALERHYRLGEAVVVQRDGEIIELKGKALGDIVRKARRRRPKLLKALGLAK